MPINPSVPLDFDVFPNNAIQVITAALEGVHPAFENQAYPRQLRPTDPNPCIGVYGGGWMPQQETLEIGHGTPWEPTLQTYQVVVQAMNKDADKDIALARHSTIAQMMRMTLYRNEPLRLLLTQLFAETGTLKESFRKMTLVNQRFLSNEISGQFVFLSVLDLSIETETR